MFENGMHTQSLNICDTMVNLDTMDSSRFVDNRTLYVTPIVIKDYHLTDVGL